VHQWMEETHLCGSLKISLSGKQCRGKAIRIASETDGGREANPALSLPQGTSTQSLGVLFSVAPSIRRGARTSRINPLPWRQMEFQIGDLQSAPGVSVQIQSTRREMFQRVAVETPSLVCRMTPLH
jgi:hypothetical protein